MHRTDIRNAMIALCCKPRQVDMRPQIVALVGLGITNIAHVLLSRKSIDFIDNVCVEKGIVGEPVIFQTKDDKAARQSSIVGTGASANEKAVRWIIGEFTL